MLVKALSQVPVAPVRLPQGMISSVFDLRRRSAGLRLCKETVRGFEVPYLEGGRPDAPPVLFIHGFSDNKDSFVDVARAVVDGHRVVLLDLPGFGEASSPEDFHYDLPAIAALVVGFCDAVGLRDAHLVGSSLGGAVATQVTLERPDLTRSLTLIGAAGLAMPTPSPLQRRLDAGDNPFVVDSFEGYETFMRFVLERQPPVPGPVRRFMADEFIGRAALNGKIMTDLLDRDFDLTDRLGEIEAETLVLWGDRDRLIDISVGRVYRDRIAQARMVVFHGIGHCPQYECPEQTGRYIRRFFERIEADDEARAAS